MTIQTTHKVERPSTAPLPEKFINLPDMGNCKETIQNTHDISKRIIPNIPHPSSVDSIAKDISNEVKEIKTISATQRAAGSTGIAPKGLIIDSFMQNITSKLQRKFSESSTPETTLKESLADIDKTQKSLEAKSEKAQKLGQPQRANYLIQMSKLIGEISILINQWNNRDSHRVEEKKKTYQNGSNLIQNSLQSKAISSLVFAIGGFALASFIGAEGGTMIHQGSDIANAFFDKDTQKGQQENSLIQTEIQKLNEGSSSNNALRDQGLQILGEIKQWLERAISRS